MYSYTLIYCDLFSYVNMARCNNMPAIIIIKIIT